MSRYCTTSCGFYVVRNNGKLFRMECHLSQHGVHVNDNILPTNTFQIAKTVGSMFNRSQSDTFASGRCQFDAIGRSLLPITLKYGCSSSSSINSSSSDNSSSSSKFIFQQYTKKKSQNINLHNHMYAWMIPDDTLLVVARETEAHLAGNHILWRPTRSEISWLNHMTETITGALCRETTDQREILFTKGL